MGINMKNGLRLAVGTLVKLEVLNERGDALCVRVAKVISVTDGDALGGQLHQLRLKNGNVITRNEHLLKETVVKVLD